MNTPPPPPAQLANRVIRQLIDHLFGEDMITLKDDFMGIRVVYRQLGGTWVQLTDGNNDSIDLLEKIVIAWGKAPGRKLKSKESI